MPKSNTHWKRRIKLKSLVQVVMTAPSRIKVSKKRYMTAKGIKLLAVNMISKAEAWKKYGKFRYKDNPEAKPTTNIHHGM